MNWPSAERVTSTKLSSSSKVSITEMMVVRWLFHFRQNSCPEALPPTTAPLAMAPRLTCNRRSYLLGPDGDAACQRFIHHLQSSAGEAHYMNNISSSGPDVETAGEPEQLLRPVAHIVGRRSRKGKPISTFGIQVSTREFGKNSQTIA